MLFAKLVLGLALGALLLACETTPEESLGLARRLSKGHYRDDTPRFSPDGKSVIFVRQFPEEEDKGDIRQADAAQETRIFEAEIAGKANNAREIRALAGVNWPSYLGSDAYVALSPQARLVVLKKGQEEPKELVLRQFAGRPAKPVGSPDGRHIAFLASALPNKAAGAAGGELDVFRYEAYVVEAQGGVPRAVTAPFTKSARLVALDWADEGHLNATYQVLDAHDDLTRVERVDIADGTREFRLFTDYATPLSFPNSVQFFASAKAEAKTALFVWRDASRESRQFLKVDVSGVWLSPDGQRALLALYDSKENGVNFYLLPLPETFLNPPAAHVAPAKK